MFISSKPAKLDKTQLLLRQGRAQSYRVLEPDHNMRLARHTCVSRACRGAVYQLEILGSDDYSSF